MKEFSAKRLFEIFDKSDDGDLLERSGIKDFYDHPFLTMGMVVRGIDNFDLLCEIYDHKYPKEFPSIKDEVKFKYYSRLYRYLDRFNYKQIDSIEKTLAHGYDNILYCLIDMRVTFETHEEYERCGRIRDIITSYEDYEDIFIKDTNLSYKEKWD